MQSVKLTYFTQNKVLKKNVCIPNLFPFIILFPADAQTFHMKEEIKLDPTKIKKVTPTN